jgi:small ubiquitin-related modifier
MDHNVCPYPFWLKCSFSAPHFALLRFVNYHPAMEEDAAAAPIQLKVKDQQGSELLVKLKKSTPLRKLMDASCSRLGLAASQVCFTVDSVRIEPEDTAETLGLEDEDIIDVAPKSSFRGQIYIKTLTGKTVILDVEAITLEDVLRGLTDTPKAHAKDVDATTSITVVLDDNIRTVQVDKAIILKRHDNTSAVAGMTTYSKATRTLTFKPALPLMPNTKYTVRLPMSAFTYEYQFSFETQKSKPLLLYVQLADRPEQRRRFTFVAEENPYNHLRTALAARLGLDLARIDRIQCSMGGVGAGSSQHAMIMEDFDVL